MRIQTIALKTLIAAALMMQAFSAHAGQTSYYIYDESGHVIGEYDANGNPVQEHIYLGDRPVAVAVTSGTTTTMDYVQTDQLNTPRIITDQNQTVLWSWNDTLHEMAQKYGCAIHAYVLMTNHVHLLLTPKKADSAGLLMKHLGQRYVQYINRVYRRSGTLWEGRFRSCLTQNEEYVLSCYRYIELNPVRASMVEPV